MDGTDAIRAVLATQLVAAQQERDAVRADNDQLRALNADLRRALLRERAERRAEADRRASAVRWVLH